MPESLHFPSHILSTSSVPGSCIPLGTHRRRDGQSRRWCRQIPDLCFLLRLQGLFLHPLDMTPSHPARLGDRGETNIWMDPHPIIQLPFPESSRASACRFLALYHLPELPTPHTGNGVNRCCEGTLMMLGSPKISHTTPIPTQCRAFWVLVETPGIVAPTRPACVQTLQAQGWAILEMGN